MCHESTGSSSEIASVKYHHKSVIKPIMRSFRLLCGRPNPGWGGGGKGGTPILDFTEFAAQWDCS